MMRRTLCVLERRDIIESLLRRHHLSDIQMSVFFANQVERELAAAAASAAAPNAATSNKTTTSTSTTTTASVGNIPIAAATAASVASAAATAAAGAGVSGTESSSSSSSAAASPSSAAAAARAAAAEATEAAATAPEPLHVPSPDPSAPASVQLIQKKQAARAAALQEFWSKRAAVRAAAAAHPLSWLGLVYGTEEWSSSYLTANTLRAELADDGSSSNNNNNNNNTKVKLTGRAVIAGGVPSDYANNNNSNNDKSLYRPKSAIVVANLDGVARAVRVSLSQQQQQQQQSSSSSSVLTVSDSGAAAQALRLEMHGAEGVLVPLPSAFSSSSSSADVEKGEEVSGSGSSNADAREGGNNANNNSNNNSNGSSNSSNNSNKKKKNKAAQALMDDIAADTATTQHILNADAYCGILGALETICALHATQAAAYDGLLIRNPAVQMRLSQLACLRYAARALSDYVAGDGEPVGDASTSSSIHTTNNNNHDGASGSGSAASAVAAGTLGLPLVESAVLSVFAETALMEGLDSAWEVLRDTPQANRIGSLAGVNSNNNNNSSGVSLNANNNNNNSNNTTTTNSTSGDKNNTSGSAVAVDTPLINTGDVPHRSNPSRVIRYTYARELFAAPKYALTSLDGAMEVQIMEFLHPLLALHSGAAGTAAKTTTRGGSNGANSSSASDSSPAAAAAAALAKLGSSLDLVAAAKRLAGLTSGGSVALAAVHPNLSVSARKVEADLSQFLELAGKVPLATSPSSSASSSSNSKSKSKSKSAAGANKEADAAAASLHAIALTQVLAELFACVACLHRCTAALSQDEAGLGHREWMLAQAFCAGSSARRQRILSDLRMADAARAAMAGASPDSYSTHPVELMSAAAAASASASSKA